MYLPCALICGIDCVCSSKSDLWNSVRLSTRKFEQFPARVYPSWSIVSFVVCDIMFWFVFTMLRNHLSMVWYGVPSCLHVLLCSFSLWCISETAWSYCLCIQVWIVTVSRPQTRFLLTRLSNWRIGGFFMVWSWAVGAEAHKGTIFQWLASTQT